MARPTSKIEAWPSQDELELLRDACRRNFWTFFLWGFGAGANPKGERWIEPAVHEPLADWFQMHILDWMSMRKEGRGEQKHLAVLVHREVGKTTMIAQAGQAWLHLLDPEISSYTGSERLELAQKILGGVKAVLDGSDPYALFSKLYGEWAGQARIWTGKEVVHAARKNTSRKDPSLGTFAVETSIVGAHPDAIFYDDPISYERLMSDSNWLESVNLQVTSLFPVIQSDGLVVWVGTRYDDSDHFGVAFRDEGVCTVSGLQTDSIPTSPEGKWHVYFLAGRDSEGKPVTNKIWPEKRLKDYQRRDPLRYAAQVMNDPSISEFNPLTKDQIRQCIIPAKNVPWGSLRFGICCDTAFFTGSSRARKDESVFIIHGYPRDGSGDVYICEVHGSPLWRAEDMARLLVSTVQRYRRQGRKIVGISDEIPVGKGGAWKIALGNFFADAGEPMPPYYEYNRMTSRTGGKVQRMIAAATFWVDGHVKVVESGPNVDRLMDQMGRIGQYMINANSRDDYADAHADAFQPEFYQQMKRLQQASPWDKGANPLRVDGLNPDDFDDSDERNWSENCPRPPVRNL